jgi:tetratricopeptide (TPR) repeat protein
LALAAALVFPLQGAGATVDEQAALQAYVRARVANSVGAQERAVEAYRAALALAPHNETLAARALDEGLAAGDRPLALSAAKALDGSAKLQVGGRLILFGEALRGRDWAYAGRQIDRIQEDEVFSFLAPLLRAWLAEGSGKGDPLAFLEGLGDNPLAAAYADEQKPLLLLAGGRRKEGLAALGPVLEQAGAREARLRIAAAALLARKGSKAEALPLLEGDGDALAVARDRLKRGKRLTGEIASPSAGVAELLVRIAVDLNAQEVNALALDFARLASFLDPSNGEARIVAGELLTADGKHEEALAALALVAADDPFARLASDNRTGALMAAGREDEALARIRSEVAAEPEAAESWTRLGDLLSRMSRPADAADAYGKALALARSAGAEGQKEWSLLLLQGGALVESGRWAEGKAALEASYRLAPEQPVVLNYLGYSQLERRENVAEAERLIGEASRLDPGNAAITDSLGWAHFLRGDLPRAIELLERAAQSEPADAAIKEHLGDAYFRAGRRYEARYAWQAALVFAEGNALPRLRAKVDSGLTAELAAP